MRRIQFIPLFLLLLVACQREFVPVIPGDEARVTVSLSLTVAPEEAGTPATRAAGDDPAPTDIHNLCIMQYRGTADDAPLVGEPIYLSDEADPADDEKYLDLNRIRMRGSAGETHALVILANTYAKLPAVATFGEMKALYRTLGSLSDLYPEDGALRMNALAVTEIDHGTVIHAVLRRSISRIRVNIANDGTDGLVIRDVQLRNIPQKDYYLTSYSYLDPATLDERALAGENGADDYDAAHPMRMDAPAVAWTGDADGTGTGSFSWFIPANQRGTDVTVTNPGQKGNSPLAEGATYLQINAFYGDAHDQPIVYRFYLGADMLGDFNLRPNGAYSYQFSFSGTGDPLYDERIEDLSRVDFDVDANTYMLHPLADAKRVYTINVVHRPNIFWGGRYGLKDDYPENRVFAGETWYARLLWSSFEMTQDQANAFLSKREGTGAGGYLSDDQRIHITLPAGQREGIVSVGVYTDDPDYMLWSWMLWITAYDPDAIDGREPVDGVYLYDVPGGEVHRYAGESWKSGGRYEKGFAMDRNLGAPDVKNHDYGSGAYFQWGRKDPFPPFKVIWFYDPDGIPAKKTGGPWSIFTGPHFSTDNDTWKDAKHPIPGSVIRPTYRMGDNFWVPAGGIFNPIPYDSSLYWFDPRAKDHSDYEESGKNLDKTFFDPCPPGWRLPRYGYSGKEGWVSGFMGDGQGSSTASASVNFQWGVETFNGHMRGLGRTYYPNGFLADKDNPDAPTIFFPTDGTSNYAYYWTDSPMSYQYTYTIRPTYVSTGRTLEFTNSYSGARINGDYNVNSCMVIRCVRE